MSAQTDAPEPEMTDLTVTFDENEAFDTEEQGGDQ